MRAGICGLPLSGKTTIFNILTGAEIKTGGYHSGVSDVTNVSVVQVPDKRLDVLFDLFKPRKKVYSTIEYVDVAGIIKDSGRDSNIEKAVFSHLMGMDMLMVVIRAFQDANVPHPEGSVNPKRDIDIFQTELLFRDLDIVEKRLERLTKARKKPDSGPEKIEWELLEESRESLNREKPLRELDLTSEKDKIFRGFQFMSAKPLLVVLNIGEEDIAHEKEMLRSFQEIVPSIKTKCVAVSGKLEMELAQMEEEEAQIFMVEYGVTDKASVRLTQASRDLLRLITFFTVHGEEDVHAWTIPEGTRAREAAGTVHTDMEKGFIKAEVIHYDILVEKKGSLARCRDEGLMRMEGKEYIVHDGDSIYFYFHK